MADIQTQLDRISSASSGAEVRSSIYEAIQAINQEVEETNAVNSDAVAEYSRQITNIISSTASSVEKLEQIEQTANETINSLNLIRRISGDIKIITRDPATGLEIVDDSAPKGSATFDESTGRITVRVPRGNQGDPGQDGSNGYNAYLHIRYSSSKEKPRKILQSASGDNSFFSATPVEPGYELVENPTAVNPMLLGWLEYQYGYIYTSDTEVVSGKTYYAVGPNNTFVEVENPEGNPMDLFYYEIDQELEGYITSDDTWADPEKTYYRMAASGEHVQITDMSANPKVFGYYEYNETDDYYYRTNDEIPLAGKSYYREVGSEWIGFWNGVARSGPNAGDRSKASSTPSINSDDYTWLKFRGPQGVSGSGVSEMITTMNNGLATRLEMTLLQEFTTLGQFDDQVMTDDRYKGYDAIMVVMRFASDANMYYTVSYGSLRGQTSAQKKATTKKAALPSPEYNTPVASAVTHPPYYTEESSVMVFHGKTAVNIHQEHGSGNVASRRISYNKDTGRIWVSNCTYQNKVGPGGAQGFYCSNNWDFAPATGQLIYKYKSKTDYKTFDRSYPHHLQSWVSVNHWLVPVRIYGVKHIQ